MNYRIFVYGLLLQSSGERAVLRDWKLGFFGFATIRPSLGSVVEGRLISGDLHRIDQMEGYKVEEPNKGLYNRVLVEVETEHNKEHAWVYFHNETGHNPGIFTDVLESMYTLYQVRGIPLEQLREAVQNP